jgi:hypothetical protein
MEPTAEIKLYSEVAVTALEREEVFGQIYSMLFAAGLPEVTVSGYCRLAVSTAYGLLEAAADGECPGWREEGRFRIVPVGLPEL